MDFMELKMKIARDYCFGALINRKFWFKRRLYSHKLDRLSSKFKLVDDDFLSDLSLLRNQTANGLVWLRQRFGNRFVPSSGQCSLPTVHFPPIAFHPNPPKWYPVFHPLINCHLLLFLNIQTATPEVKWMMKSLHNYCRHRHQSGGKLQLATQTIRSSY